jgi:hypothetical protein
MSIESLTPLVGREGAGLSGVRPSSLIKLSQSRAEHLAQHMPQPIKSADGMGWDMVGWDAMGIMTSLPWP